MHRLRPKLLTEGVAIIAIFPMVFAKGVGGEILAPMALPVLGGLLISDEVVDLFLPVRFYWVRRARWLTIQKQRAEAGDGSRSGRLRLVAIAAASLNQRDAMAIAARISGGDARRSCSPEESSTARRSIYASQTHYDMLDVLHRLPAAHPGFRRCMLTVLMYSVCSPCRRLASRIAPHATRTSTPVTV